jgi:Flp pilus assembly protein CpaB
LKRSNRLILLIGIVLAVATFAGIVLLFQGNRAGTSGTPPAPQELPTVFATRDITLGTEVTTDMLEVRQQPITGRDATAYGSDSLVLGQVARKNIAAGKQLTGDDFDVTGAPLTIDTPAGQRGMAVRVSQNTGVGTLIRTGDYVDLIIGYQMNVISVDPNTGTAVPGAPEINQASAKLALQGMQVLGTLLPPPPAAAEGTEGGATQGGTGLNEQEEIVILSVTSQQAEVIKHAQLQNDPTTISLVLRSPADFRDANQEPIVPVVDETTGITVRQLVDEYGLLVPEIIEATLSGDDQP